MKKLGLFLAFTFIISGLVAANNFSSLSLKLWDHSDFIVVFDGQVINHPDDAVVIRDIRPGEHHLKVIKLRRHHQKKVVYKGRIFIPRNMRIKAVIDHGRFVELKRVPKHEPKANHLSKREMDHLVFELMNTHSDHRKLAKAERMIMRKRVSSRQVARLMTYFNHENDRLHLARYAYRYTVDRRNYYLVEGSLREFKSIKKLRRFIGNHH